MPCSAAARLNITDAFSVFHIGFTDEIILIICSTSLSEFYDPPLISVRHHGKITIDNPFSPLDCSSLINTPFSSQVNFIIPSYIML